MEFEMTDEQVIRVNKALKGESVELDDEELGYVNQIQMAKKQSTEPVLAPDRLSKLTPLQTGTSLLQGMSAGLGSRLVGLGTGLESMSKGEGFESGYEAGKLGYNQILSGAVRTDPEATRATTIAGGMTNPAKSIMSNLALGGLSGATESNDLLSEDAAYRGVMSTLETGGVMAAPKVVGGLAKGILHLPAAIKGVSKKGRDLFIEDSAAVNMADEAARKREIKGIAKIGTDLRQNADNATNAYTQAKAIADMEQAAGTGNIEAAKKELDALLEIKKKAEFALATQDLKLREGSLVARDVVTAEKTKADEIFIKKDNERLQEIEDETSKIRNADPELVSGVKRQLADLKDNTSKLARDQEAFLRGKGVDTTIDVSEIRPDIENLKKTMTIAARDIEAPSSILGPDGKPVMTMQSQPRIEMERTGPLKEFLLKYGELADKQTLPDAVNLRQSIDDLIEWDKATGEYGGKAEGLLKQARTKVNDKIDVMYPDDYKELRASLSIASTLQTEASKLFGGKNIEPALSRIGGKNAGYNEGVVSRMEAAALPENSVAALFDAKRSVQQRIKDLKMNPTPRNTPELDKAEQLSKELDRRILEIPLSKRRLDQASAPGIDAATKKKQQVEEVYANLKATQDEKLKIFKGSQGTAENKAMDLGFPSGDLIAPLTTAESIVNQGSRLKPQEGVAVGSRIDMLAQESNDPELLKRIQQLGAHREIYGQPGTVSTGTSLGARIKQGGQLLPGVTVTVPLTIYKWGKKMSGTKWAQGINDAYARGPKAVAAYHYLMQQSDPAYQKETIEEE